MFKKAASVVASRRRFLGGLAAAPAIVPKIAKDTIEETIAKHAYVEATGLGSISGGSNDLTHEGPVLRKLIATATRGVMRSQIESKLYETERSVDKLDIDIANKRSFSMAAKITYQRQRNVKRRLQEQETGIAEWNMMDQYLKHIVGWKGDQS